MRLRGVYDVPANYWLPDAHPDAKTDFKFALSFAPRRTYPDWVWAIGAEEAFRRLNPEPPAPEDDEPAGVAIPFWLWGGKPGYLQPDDERLRWPITGRHVTVLRDAIAYRVNRSSHDAERFEAILACLNTILNEIDVDSINLDRAVRERIRSQLQPLANTYLSGLVHETSLYLSYSLLSGGERLEPLDRDAMQRSVERNHRSFSDLSHQMLGHGKSVCDAPQEHANDILLLQVGCIHFGWCPSYCVLQYWISAQDLLFRRFGRVKSTLECS